MEMIESPRTGFGLGPRSRAGVASALIAVVGACSLALFSADVAIEGGILERAAVPLRMLGLVLLATALLRWSGESWRELGFHRPRSLVRTGALVIGGYAAVGASATLVTGLLLPALGIAPRTSEIFAELTGDTAEYLYWLLPVAWGSAAFGEELVFRGFLQTRLERAFGPRRGAAAAALLAQATIFGALHIYLGAGGALLAAATGLVLGGVYLAAGRNLWAPIILHGLIDTVTLTAFYLGAVPAGT